MVSLAFHPTGEQSSARYLHLMNRTDNGILNYQVDVSLSFFKDVSAVSHISASAKLKNSTIELT